MAQVGKDLKDHQIQLQPDHSILTLTTLCWIMSLSTILVRSSNHCSIHSWMRLSISRGLYHTSNWYWYFYIRIVKCDAPPQKIPIWILNWKNLRMDIVLTLSYSNIMVLQKSRTDLHWKTFTTAREIPQRDGRFSVRRSAPLLLSCLKATETVGDNGSGAHRWVCPLLLQPARSCQRKPIISTKIKASLITEPWSGASSRSFRQKL